MTKRKRRKTRKDKIQFSDEQIVQIETMAGYGLTQLQICHIIFRNTIYGAEVVRMIRKGQLGPEGSVYSNQFEAFVGLVP